MTSDKREKDEDGTSDHQLDEETQKVLDEGLRRYKKAMDELAER